MPDTGVEPRTNFSELLQQIAAEPAIDSELRARLEGVRELLAVPVARDQPFLTVMLRTQGQRIEPLKDALVCLVGQTDQDFEVVVLVHDATADAAEAVAAIVARQPAGFRKRLTVVPVVGGTRAKPLNAGLAVATGTYVAVFDDDDLVFANWVDEFHRAAQNGPGRLLRALVANQSVAPEVWPDGSAGFRTLSLPKVEFPVRFDQVDHLLVNVSPFMSWAFPRELFSTFGVRFDEELTVAEDWDVILRGSLLCGVDEINALTSIYRRWENGVSSYNLHSTAAWQASERRVIDKLNSSVMLFPPGTVDRLRALALLDNAWNRYRYLFRGNQLRQPLAGLWNAAYPAARGLRRVRNRIRRARG